MLDNGSIRAIAEAYRALPAYQNFIREEHYPTFRRKLIGELPDYSTSENEAAIFLRTLPFIGEEQWFKLINVEKISWPRIAGELDALLSADHFQAENEQWTSQIKSINNAILRAEEIFTKYGIKVTLKKAPELGQIEDRELNWLHIEHRNSDVAAPTPPFRFVRIESLFLPELFPMKQHQRWKSGITHYKKSDPLDLFHVKIPRFVPTPATPLSELKTFKEEVRNGMAIKEEYDDTVY